MTDMTKAPDLGELDMTPTPVVVELRRLEHNTTVLMNALMKACGDDEELVKEMIESQGELK